VPASPRFILQLTGMNSTKYGAMEQYIVETVRRCAASGFDSAVQYETRPASESYCRELRELGTRLVVAPTSGRNAGTLAGLWRLFRQSSPAAILTHFSARHVIAAAGTLGRLPGAGRVVSMVHNVHHLGPRSLARIAYNRCDRVLAVSEAVHRDLLAGGVSPRRVSTHYLGLFGEREAAPSAGAAIRTELGIAGSARVLANIAFEAPFKGVDVLLEALHLLPPECGQVHLIQVGVDPGRSALPAMADRLGLGERVHWAGIRDAAWQLLHAADVYVQPSRYGEGLPLAIMEAMALGIPVVATGVSGNAEAVVPGVTGLLAEPGDARHLAQTLAGVLREPAQWPAMGEAARSRFASLFSGPESVRRLVEDHLGLVSSTVA